MESINLDEVGWFYHVHNKPARKEDQVPCPPISQIIGLRQPEYDLCEQPESHKTVLFKDTDSDYIRLAKVGGRKDLLCMLPEAELTKLEKAPPPVVRNDWFYYLDNECEDAANRKSTSHQPLLPEYMVHEDFTRSQTPSVAQPCIPPFSYDRMSAFQRDDCRPNDKTVRLQEERQPGYGVRCSKPLKVRKNDGGKYGCVPGAKMVARTGARVFEKTDPRRPSNTGLLASIRADHCAPVRSVPYSSSMKGRCSSSKIDPSASSRAGPYASTRGFSYTSSKTDPCAPARASSNMSSKSTMGRQQQTLPLRAMCERAPREDSPASGLGVAAAMMNTTSGRCELPKIDSYAPSSRAAAAVRGDPCTPVRAEPYVPARRDPCAPAKTGFYVSSRAATAASVKKDPCAPAKADPCPRPGPVPCVASGPSLESSQPPAYPSVSAQAAQQLQSNQLYLCHCTPVAALPANGPAGVAVNNATSQSFPSPAKVCYGKPAAAEASWRPPRKKWC